MTVASNVVALTSPMAGTVLGHPLPGDPLELLGAAETLSGAGLYDDAAAVTRLAERAALLAVTGRAIPTAPTIRDAIRAADAAEPPIDALREAALERIRLRIPSPLGHGAEQTVALTDPSLMPPTGGEWTGHLLREGAVLRVPVEAEFAAAAGAIGGLSGKITLQPKAAGRPIVMTLNERQLTGDRFRHGSAFWVATRVISPQPVSEAELRAALRGLTSGSVQAKVELQVAWMTPGDDPEAPFLIISRGRGAIVDDRFRRIAAWSAPGGGRSASESANLPARCQAVPVDAVPASASGSTTPRRFDADRAPIPLTSPLMQSVLARPMASDAATLLDLRALFDVAGHPDEATKIAAMAERNELLGVLDERVGPQGTVGVALSAPAPTRDELARLRSCVMHTAIGIDLVNGDSTHGVDFFGRAYVREAPHALASGGGNSDGIAVPLEISNHSAARLAEFEFTVRLTPIAGGEPLLLRVDHSGGAALRDREHTTVNARVSGTNAPADPAALDAIVAAARRGDYAAEVSDWTLTYGGEPRFRLSPSAFNWLDSTDREVKATQFLKAATCTEMASCTTARSGRGLSSGTTWVVIELVLAALLPLALARRYTPRRGFAWLYLVYTAAAIGAALLLRLDPPTGGGLSGILSVGAAFMLGLPWPMVLLRVPLVTSGLNALFLSADAGVVAAWIGIALNHLILGTLAFLPRGDAGEKSEPDSA